jgi:hypothetical protein
MRPRIKKSQVASQDAQNQFSYEKVNLSRFFAVKARKINKAWNKLQAYQHKEIMEMFSSLTVDNLLADRREARETVTPREGEEKVISFIRKVVMPTSYEVKQILPDGTERILPKDFQEFPQVVSEAVTVIKWQD